MWIVITGLDGSGKTTLKNNLIGYLKEKDVLVKDFKVPYDNHLIDLMNNVVGQGRPLTDNYTDQILFTLDNRILGTVLVKEWKRNYEVLVSQRGYIDSFVHGECRGFSYEETDALMKTADLEKCDVMIHLNADPVVAFERIKNDPDADKFETLSYIKKQAEATNRAYIELEKGKNPALNAFKGIKNLYINTTKISTDDTFEMVLNRLKKMQII